MDARSRPPVRTPCSMVRKGVDGSSPSEGSPCKSDGFCWLALVTLAHHRSISPAVGAWLIGARFLSMLPCLVAGTPFRRCVSHSDAADGPLQRPGSSAFPRFLTG
jgi:hypothetical protein